MKNGNRILVIGNKTYVLGKPIESRRKAVPEKPDGYSIMGGPSFVHKAYLEMYFDPTIVPVSAVEYVEKLNNCEDILLSIVVTKFLQDTDTSNVTHTGVLTMKTSLTIKHLQEESSKFSHYPIIFNLWSMLSLYGCRKRGSAIVKETKLLPRALRVFE